MFLAWGFSAAQSCIFDENFKTRRRLSDSQNVREGEVRGQLLPRRQR